MNRTHAFLLSFIMMPAAYSVAADESAFLLENPPVFEMPKNHAEYVAIQARIRFLFARRAYAEAEKACRKGLELVPEDPDMHYNLACALSRQDRGDEAMSSLSQALTHGFTNTAIVRMDPDLAILRQLPELEELLSSAASRPKTPGRAIKPMPIGEHGAAVEASNTAWDTRRGLLHTYFQFEDNAPTNVSPVLNFGVAGERVNAWFMEGHAAGNWGDLYDNRDRGHAVMTMSNFPQITRTVYGIGPRSKHLDGGFQTQFVFNAPTIGNSSIAVMTEPYWRSLPRLVMLDPLIMSRLAILYRANHLYVYPEHRDHDPGRNGVGDGYGDVYPANTPYVVISQGSSWSDLTFLDALACTLAAFPPDVKEFLKQHGALAPTLQMILRRTAKHVEEDSDYLDGLAHPTVFRSEDLNVLSMVELAHEMTPERVPPLAEVRVLEEEAGRRSLEHFEPLADERLFDTPSAVARVHRSVRYSRRMVVSAAGSRDLNGLPLTWHWVILRGDPERITITPRNESKSEVELVVDYHARRPITPGSPMESSRVDIGVFAHNGAYYSAPAFVTTFFLENERRVYDAAHNIREVDYADETYLRNYVDPALALSKTWRDVYTYDEEGRMLGWVRHRDGLTESFTADGAIVIERDAADRPSKARAVLYGAAKAEDESAPPSVRTYPTEQVYIYGYDSDDDRRGAIRERIRMDKPPDAEPAQGEPSNATPD